MTFRPIYEGWDFLGRIGDQCKIFINSFWQSGDHKKVAELASLVSKKIKDEDLETSNSRQWLVETLASNIQVRLGAEPDIVEETDLNSVLTKSLSAFIAREHYFTIPKEATGSAPVKKSELWEIEDQLRRSLKIIENMQEAMQLVELLYIEILDPLVQVFPMLLREQSSLEEEITFQSELLHALTDGAETIEALIQIPFADELNEFELTQQTKLDIQASLHRTAGGLPPEMVLGEQRLSFTLPTKARNQTTLELVREYLGNTSFKYLFDASIPVRLPERTRFEHHHIVAGSGHGKTQMLQYLILRDLDAVARGQRSIVVIDSQSDLINNIAGLDVFKSGGPLADRLCIIDPTDVEWPVALNLFDAGLERLDQYSQLDRERLTNSILELYDFVLGSLLDAGMTQKQSVIFRYITRLMLHIPNATIHTLRELLEDDGFEKYQLHIEKLEGSARSFFEQEFRGKEFTQTRKQVLRRLYGILENQTFERMFSHPKSKLDIFTELNSGKVILINTAKELLKENGTEIFGRFFIAMIAQAAQERATLPEKDRLPTYIYIDEANDYFDRTIGVILSQARKYKIGMVLAHQYLGQLEPKLQEAVFANTSIRMAGGVSAKDARTLSSEMRADVNFLDRQPKLSFAAYIKGQTENSASIAIKYGDMERLPRLNAAEKQKQLDYMREHYATHYTTASEDRDNPDETEEMNDVDQGTGKPNEDWSEWKDE